MSRLQIYGVWFTVLWAVSGVTFITFMAVSSPLNLAMLPVLGLMWACCISLTYCAVQIHRTYWK